MRCKVRSKFIFYYFIIQFLEADMATLRTIIEWFSSHGFRQGLIDSYATKRGTMIRRSLQL
jgi:hypothetical protein